MRSYGGLKSQDVEKIDFLRIFQKRPLTVKFSKLYSERIHRWMNGFTNRRVVFKFREIWRTEICKIVDPVRARK